MPSPDLAIPKRCAHCNGAVLVTRNSYGVDAHCLNCGRDAMPAQPNPVEPGHCADCGVLLSNGRGAICSQCGQSNKVGKRSDAGQARHGRTNPDYDSHASRSRNRGPTVQGHYQSK